MYSDRRSLLLLALIAALPFFLFVSFRFAFDAQNRQRALERQAFTDSQLLIARTDGLVREALAFSKVLAADPIVQSGDATRTAARINDMVAASPQFADAAIDDNGTRQRRFDLTRRIRQVGPFLDPGRSSISLARTPACNCITVSRGVTLAGARPATLHLYLPNRIFFALLPSARDQYEVSATADREGRFVARSLKDAERFNIKGSVYLQRAAALSIKQGSYTGLTLEGVKNYTTFARSDLTGWSAHVAVKAQRIDDPALAFRVYIGLAVLLSLALAGLLYFVARQQIETTRNITRRIQEAQKLEALGQLTGGMAHDFNNLLTPIVGALDRLMRSDNLDAREKRFAKGAFESAERAAALTAQLLTFSRRQKLEIKVVEVAEMLTNVCELAGQSLEVSHELDCSTEPDTPPVATDKVQLELAILNLILNARDSMPTAGTVQIRAAPILDYGRPSVVFSVADRGSGMDPATASRALEPFFTTKSQGAGTGLGLAQVAEVAKQSGGRIEIDSELGRGTIIRLILPAAEATASATAIPITGQGRDLSDKLNLLIVDDNADVRETIVQMVEADGHRVESVADGRTALAALSNRKPDLLLVDFAMPGLNGAELISKAHEIHPGLPCLLITGYWDSDALADYGVTCPILRKPFTSEALRDAMAAALDAN